MPVIDEIAVTPSQDGTFGWLQCQLAEMAGGNGLETLPPQEVGLIKSSINQAYRECYWTRPNAGVASKAPQWAQKVLGFLIKASTQDTQTFVQGSTAFTLGANLLNLQPGDEGAILQINNTHYTFAGFINQTPQLVEPFDQASGTYPIIVYFRSVMLPMEVSEAKSYPEILGQGGCMLMPIAGRGDEAMLRNVFVRDFYAFGPGMGYLSFPNIATGERYIVGNPRGFWVESQPNFDGTVRMRLCVYPLPSGPNPRAMRLQCSVLPAFLVNDTDIPGLPVNTSQDILLPIARAIYATKTRRYAGDVKLALMEGDSARLRLASFVQQQKRPLRYSNYGQGNGYGY